MDLITKVPDFPEKGVTFHNIAPLLANPKEFKQAIKDLLTQVDGIEFDVIAGLDARGFILATAIQYESDKPQIMIRKASKLPGDKHSASYSMEYGQPKTIEIETTAITRGQKVLLVDDLLATGGTMAAAVELVKQAGAEIAAVLCLVGLDGLGGKEKLAGVTVKTLWNFPTSAAPVVQLPPMPRTKKFIEYRPTKFTNTDNHAPILMWHPTMELMAQRMMFHSNFRPSYVDWGTFPDGWPNIKFEPSQTLGGKDLTFIFDLSNKEIFTQQMCLLIALPRQRIRSLTILVPYLGPATHERVEFSGMLATVEPIMKLISQSIPLTQTGPAVLRIFDIHALPIRFYSSDNITMKLMSAIPLLLQRMEPGTVVAFPDDGAYKRFRHYFDTFPIIICGKVRGVGNERTVYIQNYHNWPVDVAALEKCKKRVIIVDDLAQSGETLLACARGLVDDFVQVEAFVTHAVFPNDAWFKFSNSALITRFYITNTNPLVADKLKTIAPFEVIEIEGHFIRELSRDVPSVRTFTRHTNAVQTVYVASTNVDKLEACSQLFCKSNECFDGRVIGVEGIDSGVPKQPFGLQEIELGVRNRMSQLRSLFPDSQDAQDDADNDRLLVAIENGIIYDLDQDQYSDVAFVMAGSTINHSLHVKIPKQYNDYVKRALANPTEVTFGELIEKALALPAGQWHKYVGEMDRVDQIVSSAFT